MAKNISQVYLLSVPLEDDMKNTLYFAESVLFIPRSIPYNNHKEEAVTYDGKGADSGIKASGKAGAAP